MTSAHRQIATYLTRVRRRLNAVALGEAVGVGLLAVVTASVVGLTAAGWAGAAVAWVGSALGWLLLVAGLVVAAIAGWRLWLLPLRRRSSDTEVALYVEDRIGGLHSAVVTSVQTRALMHAQGPEAARDTLGFSAALAQATAENAAATLLHYPPKGLVPSDRAKRWGAAALGAVAAAALLAALAPQLLSRGWDAMTEGSSQAQAVAAAEIGADMIVDRFKFRIEPPVYLGLQPREESSNSGNLRAVAGSKVRYVATTRQAIASAVIVFESDPEARWAVTVRSGGVMEGEMRIGTDDRYRFIAVLDGGQVVSESRWRSVVAVPDAQPSVRLLLPEGDLEVHAKDDVQAVFEASDDFGLASVDLVVLGEGGEELVRRAVSTPQGARAARGATTLTVAELGLKPGDSVQMMFEAKDTNTLSGPGVGLSEVRTLTMYSAEREHEALLKQLERLIDGLVDVVADRLESPMEGKKAKRLSSYIATQESISTKEALALKALDKLAVALRTDSVATDAFRADLAKAQLALKAAHDHEAAQIHKALSPDIITPQPSVLVQLLHVANEDASEALEGTIFELKRLLDQARQDKLLESGREMLEAQSELRELMEKMKSGDEKAKRQALAKIAQLRQKLAKMQRDMMRLAEAVPYENQNMSQRPPGEMDDAKSMEDRLKQIEELMQRGDVEEALKQLESLNKNTQEMMAGLQNDFRRVGAPSQSGRRMAGEFQQKLNELADGQRGLNAETSEQNRQSGEPSADGAAKAMEGARADAKALRDKLAKIDPSALHPSDKAALDKIKSDAGRLEDQLAKMDGDGAGGTAGDIANKSDGLSKEVGEGAARATKAEKVEALEGVQSKLAEAAKAARELAGKLGQGEGPSRSASAKPQAPQDPQETKKGDGKGQGKGGQGKGSEGKGGEGKGSEGLRALGKRQDKLAKQLGGLGEALDQLEAEMPGVRDQLKPKLEGARSKMEKAAKELGQGRGRFARQRQDAAQEQLNDAIKRLSEAVEKQRGKPGDKPGVNDPGQKVGIPGASDLPGDFREELLKAMKERAPKRFKEHIDKYYKELVK